MIVGTAIVSRLAVQGRAHRPSVIVLDILGTAGLTLLSIPAQTPAQQHGGMVTITTIWAAGPTIEAALLAGPLGGVVAAVLQFATAALVAEEWHGRTLYSGVLLIVTGAVVGLVSQLVVRAESDLRVAAATQSALAERERLARSIHDGVLQVLALVHRAGAEAGGQWATLAAAAAEQEAALRGLITSHPAVPTADGRRDLTGSLVWPQSRSARKSALQSSNCSLRCVLARAGDRSSTMSSTWRAKPYSAWTKGRLAGGSSSVAR
jgi:hypothetical protein